jgi:hypothetical protein
MAGLALERSARPTRSAPAGRPAISPRIERPLTRRILLVILDAWRRKVAFDDARMPRLAELARRGSRGTVLTGVRTFTKACVREMMTGRPASLRDSTRNLMNDPVSESSLFTRMSDASFPFMLIDVIGDLQGLFERQCPPGSRPALSVKGLSFDPADPAHDALAEAATANALGDPRQRLVVVHLESLDLGGHIFIPDTPSYDRVLRAADERIWRLCQRLDLSQSALVVIGDHGTDDRGHHGGPDLQARQTAYLAVGAGIRRGDAPLDPLDLADSLAVLLGLCPPEDSVGAPQSELLAIDRGELKARCDRCLRDRLEVSGHVATSSVARKYFAASSFTSPVADFYKQAASPSREERWPAAALVIGGGAIIFGLHLLRLSCRLSGFASAWVVPATIVLLSLSMERDTVAVLLYAAMLLYLALSERRGRGMIAIAASAALMAALATSLPASDSSRVANGVGQAALLLAALCLTRPALRPSPARRTNLLVLTPLYASAVVPLISTNQIPGQFSAAATLTDYALAAGVLFLLLGVLLEDDSMAGLAAMALAACFFRGWSLTVFILLAALWILGRRRERISSFLPTAIWGPLGALALLRAENGGYGFSRIDLSLSAIGIPWDDAGHYGWGASIIVLSYLVSLALARGLSRKLAGSPQPVLDTIPAAFLLFAGVDILLLALSGASLFGVARLEEVFVFDVVLGVLALFLRGLGWAGDRIGGRGVGKIADGPRSLTVKALSS